MTMVAVTTMIVVVATIAMTEAMAERAMEGGYRSPLSSTIPSAGKERT